MAEATSQKLEAPKRDYESASQQVDDREAINTTSSINTFARNIKHLHITGTTNISDKALRLFLVGPTGGGKSSSGNTILNRHAFDVEKASPSSVTDRPVLADGLEGDTYFKVMDTPGFFDTEFEEPNRDAAAFKAKIVHAFGNLKPGPHAILFTIDITTHSPLAFSAFERLTQFFGEYILMNTIILFTRGDKLGQMKVETYLEEAPGKLKEMIRLCDNRYIVFNNENRSDRSQVRKLLDKIQDFGNLYFFSDSNQIDRQTLEKLEKENRELKGQLAETQKQLAKQK